MENEINKSETPSSAPPEKRPDIREKLIRKMIGKLRPGIEALYAGKTDNRDLMALRFLYRRAKEPAVTSEIRLPEEPLLTGFTEKTHAAFTEDGYVESQRRLRGVPFGDRGNTADHGCGWVSYYNVRRLTGFPIEPLDALRAAWRGQRRGGLKGTDPFYLIKLLRSDGYYAELFFAKEEAERAARCADGVIVLYLYQKRERLFGHFVAAKYDKETDGFITYNGEGGNTAHAAALWEIASRRSFFTMIIAVSRKR